jgi:hypothetical protein
LACFLAKNAVYWLSKKQQLSELLLKELVQTCVLLAGKINERDIRIPTLPDIVIAGSKIYKAIFFRLCFFKGKIEVKGVGTMLLF